MPKQIATISIGPSLAKLSGGDYRLLTQLCSAEDDKVKNSAAYQQGRIDDCRCYLNSGMEFPSGLWRYVAKGHEKRGYEVRVRWTYRLKSIDPALVTSDLLAGITLWDHQRDIITAALNERHGHAHGSTGCGKSACAIAIALLLLREYGEKTLIIGGSKGTAYQFAKEVRRFVGDGVDIGFIGDGRKRPGDITVAVPDTLGRVALAAARGEKLKPDDQRLLDYIRNDVDCLIADECQRASGDGYYVVALLCNAKRKIGLSGTPLVRKRLRDLKMLGATGPQLIRVGSEEMIAKGLSAFPRIAVVSDASLYPTSCRDAESERLKKAGVKLRGSYAIRQYNLDYAAFLVRNAKHNRRVVVRSALWFTDRKLPCLILCRRLNHFAKLKRLLTKSGAPFAAVTGSSPTPDRVLAKKQLADGAIRILLATDIFSRGEDMPSCRGLVLAESVKSFENCMQRIGRGMRAKVKGVNEVWVVDAAPPFSRILSKQAEVRIKAYAEASYLVKRFPIFTMKRMAKFFGAEREETRTAEMANA